jgi:hypothetical protein
MELRRPGLADDHVAGASTLAGDGPAAEVAKPVLDFGREMLAAQGIVPGAAVRSDLRRKGRGAHAVQPQVLGSRPCGRKRAADQRRRPPRDSMP